MIIHHITLLYISKFALSKLSRWRREQTLPVIWAAERMLERTYMVWLGASNLSYLTWQKIWQHSYTREKIEPGNVAPVLANESRPDLWALPSNIFPLPLARHNLVLAANRRPFENLFSSRARLFLASYSPAKLSTLISRLWQSVTGHSLFGRQETAPVSVYAGDEASMPTAGMFLCRRRPSLWSGAGRTGITWRAQSCHWAADRWGPLTIGLTCQWKNVRDTAGYARQRIRVRAERTHRPDDTISGSPPKIGVSLLTWQRPVLQRSIAVMFRSCTLVLACVESVHVDAVSVFRISNMFDFLLVSGR
jgi:hypothetical protein